MSGSSTRILAGLAAGLLGGTVLVAQQTTGSFKGRVFEGNTDKPKAGVMITIRHYETNLTRQTVTGVDGTYKFVLVPVGKYRVTIKVGERPYSFDATASLGIATEIAPFHTPSEASTTVEVVAQTEAMLTNTSSAETGVNVTSEVLSTLPVLSRNVVDAAVLAPGVQMVAGANVDPTKKSSTYVSTGDGQGRGTNFAIDGADNNSTDVGGYVSTLPMDAIGEFQVVTNQYKAEFGRSNAGFFNVVTKSGGNTFAGVVSAQFTNQALRARSTDEGEKKDNRDLRYSAMVNGPIIKDRLFYMVAVERQDAQGASYTFTPEAISLYPELGSIKTETKATAAYGKIDFAATPSWNLAFTLGYDKNETPNQAFPNTTRASGNVDPGMLGTSKNETTRYGVKSTFTVGNLSWESNLSYFDYANGIVNKPGMSNGTPLQVRQDYGLKPGTECARTGFDPNAYQNTGIKRLQWRNDFTWVSGDHQVKGGFDYQDSQYADTHNFNPETGLYVMWTTSPFGHEAWSQSWDASNYVTGLLVADGFQKGQTYKNYGVYLQDDWAINAKWSVYAGIRADKDTVFDFMTPYADMYQTIHARNPQFIGAGLPQNKTYVSPRLSLIWRPNGDDNLVFRLGAGRFVANVIDNIVGFSRQLGNKANGIPNAGDLASLANFGSGGYYGSLSVYGNGGPTAVGALAGPIFYENDAPYLINGHQLVLPAALTPYNYVNNVGGLRDYFRHTVDGWLTTATVDTGGKNLMDPDFRYPTTDQMNLAMTFKWSQHHSLDANLILSRTRNLTAQYATDGSGPLAWSSDGTVPAVWDPLTSPAHDMGDNIFRSNQTARSIQLQLKYSYVAPRMSFYFNVVAKENRSTTGGSVGSFDSSGLADFYGGNAVIVYGAGPERRSTGSESLLGSFSYSYKFEIGTQIGLLGTWHSGKYYDNFEYGGNANSIYDPIPWVGTGVGDWGMDLGMRVSHAFKVGKTSVEPFLQVSNILNNYDYGANYDGQLYTSLGRRDAGVRNPHFGQRGSGYQMGQPRTAAFGFKWSF